METICGMPKNQPLVSGVESFVSAREVGNDDKSEAAAGQLPNKADDAFCSDGGEGDGEGPGCCWVLCA